MRKFRRFSDMIFRDPGEPAGGPDPASSPAPDAGAVQETIADQPGDHTGPPVSSEPWSFRSAASQMGLAAYGDYKDDATAFGNFMNEVRGIAEAKRKYEQFYNSFAGEYQSYQQWKAEQEKQKAQAEQPKKAAWDVPEYSPTWNHMVRRDENGNLVAVSGAAPDLPLKLQRYQDWQRETITKLLHDPVGTLAPLLEDKINERAKAILDEYRATIEPKQDLQEYVFRNEDWMYKHDANGRKVIDQRTGLPIWSEYGKAFTENFNHFNQVMPQGTSHKQLMELAAYATQRQVVGIEQSRQQQAQAAADPRQAYSGAAPQQPPSTVARQAASLATADANGIPQNEESDVRTMFRQAAQARGMLPQTA